jgi:hypothetical protein
MEKGTGEIHRKLYKVATFHNAADQTLALMHLFAVPLRILYPKQHKINK